jgi:putative ABC transport system permease protein
VRDAIVVTQIAMAVVLTIGSGLLVRSFVHLRAAEPGFDPRGVLVAPIFLDSQPRRGGPRGSTWSRS